MLSFSSTLPMVDLRNTCPPKRSQSVDKSLTSNKRLSNELPSINSAKKLKKNENLLIKQNEKNIDQSDMENESDSYNKEREKEESLRRLHAMIVNFCQIDNGLLSDDINLLKYSIDSGMKINNVIVQELCLIQPNITKLDLSNCVDISDVGLWAIANHCLKLKYLNLTGCYQITDVGLRSLSFSCSNLISLTLNDCYLLNDFALTVIAGGSWKIEELYLRNCKCISDSGISHVAQASESLRILDLYGCISLGEFGDNSFLTLGSIATGLKYLDISKIRRIEEAGLRSIAMGCQQLEFLALQRCDRLPGKAFKYLCNYSSKLSTLKLNNYEHLSDKDLRYMTTKTCCLKNSLTSLDISNCDKISDEGILSISLALSNSLQNISIRNNTRISNKSMTYLSKYCTNLRSLDLSHCIRLTNDCIDTLVNHVTCLTSLKLDKITNISVDQLLKYCSQLEFADIANEWFGYQPKKQAFRLIDLKEKENYEKKCIIKIQSVIRRKHAYKEYHSRYRWHCINKIIPKAQALIRGHIQRKRWKQVQQYIYQIQCIITIQCWYRKYKHIQQRLLLQRKNYIKLLDHQSAIKIQKTYRGLIGRRKCKMRRNEFVNKRLLDSMITATKERMAIIIQKNYRAYIHKKYAIELYNQKQLRIQLEQLQDRMIRLIQRHMRGKLGRMEAQRRRDEIALYHMRWLACREIQRVYRGLLGRRKVAYERLRLEREMRRLAAINIQRVFRGYRGRLLASITKALRILRIQRNNAATTIQRIARGIIDRTNVAEMKIKFYRNKLENQSATLIQRIFRGHKGREVKVIEKELRKFDVEATPLVDSLQKYEVEITKLKKTIANLENENNNFIKSLEEIENELDFVKKSTNKYSDSSRLNGTLQRYLTKWLQVQLKVFYDEQQNLYKQKSYELDMKITELRSLESQLRQARRELIPLTTGKVMSVKTERSVQLRKDVRDRMKAAIKIQSIWRGILVRKGYNDEARQYWIECYDEDQSEYPFYYNTWTEETSWNMPLAFKYFSNPLLGIKPVKTLDVPSIITEDSIEST